MNERRRKLVPVSSVLIHVDIPQTGDVSHFKCIEGLPDDVAFIGLTYDFMRDVYYFCYQSAEWDEVPDNEMLPIFTPKFINLNVALFLEQAEKLIETMYSSDTNKWLETYRAYKKLTGWPSDS